MKDKSEEEKILNPELLGQRANDLKDHLNANVLGQSSAVDEIITCFTPHFAGVQSPGRPLAVVLLIGGTGVGKTLMAEQIAKHFLGDEAGLTRVNCESYQERHEISKLIGSPPGYLNSGDACVLDQSELNKWRNLEYKDRSKPLPAVLLIDEIDKAHPALWKLLLGILSTGMLNLTGGRKTDFTSVVVLMTANWGSAEIAKIRDGNSMGFADTTGDTKDIAKNVVKKTLAPELLGRIDKIIEFDSLSRKDCEKILFRELQKVQDRVSQGTIQFFFHVSDTGCSALIDEGYSPVYGARQLKRTIERRVTTKLANLISSGQLTEGDLIEIDYKDDKYVYRHVGNCVDLLKKPPVPTNLLLLPAAPSYAEFPTFGPP